MTSKFPDHARVWLDGHSIRVNLHGENQLYGSRQLESGEARQLAGVIIALADELETIPEPVTINSIAAELGIAPGRAWTLCDGWTATITPDTELTAGGASLVRSILRPHA